MTDMAPDGARAVRRQDTSTDAVLAWIAQTLGSGRRELGAAELAALLTPLGWETTFPHGARTRASVHVVAHERMTLIRYRGAPFVGRYRRESVPAPDDLRLAVVEIVHTGRGRFLRDGSELALEPGDAILHPPSGDHAIEWLDDVCERTYVLISTRMFGRRTDAVLDDDQLLQRGVPLLPAAVNLIDLLVGEPDSLVAIGASQSLFILLSTIVATAIGRPEAPGDSTLRERVREVLLERFAEVDLDADAVALTLRVSRRHLFAQFEGSPETFGTMLRDIRLDHAAELLAGGGPNATVRRVARESGFGGPSQLARAFRDRFGITPTQFRAAAARQPALE